MPSRLVIGIDIGGTKLLGGVVDAELRVHQRIQRSMLGLDAASLLDTMQQAVEELLKAAQGTVSAVAFGIPSLIDRRSGESVSSVHLPLAGVPFRTIMQERLGLPVFVDNDGNTGALAEHRAGAAVGAREVVFVALGTGIAGGLILNGRLYRGATGAGGELGHMVIDGDGPRCQGNCPNRGCFETFCSGTALRRRAELLARERPSSALAEALMGGAELDGELVLELARSGDAAAGEVFDWVGRWLGVGLTNLVNIFNPELVVVGGGVMAAGELLLAPARSEVGRRALSPSKQLARIVAARFGSEAGMVGAGALALAELESRES